MEGAAGATVLLRHDQGIEAFVGRGLHDFSWVQVQPVDLGGFRPDVLAGKGPERMDDVGVLEFFPK